MLRNIRGTVGERLAYSLGEEIDVWEYSDAIYGSDDEMRPRGADLVSSS